MHLAEGEKECLPLGSDISYISVIIEKILRQCFLVLMIILTVLHLICTDRSLNVALMMCHHLTFT